MITDAQYERLREEAIESLTEEERQLLERLEGDEAQNGYDRNTCIDNIEAQDNTL